MLFAFQKPFYGEQILTTDMKKKAIFWLFKKTLNSLFLMNQLFFFFCPLICQNTTQCYRNIGINNLPTRTPNLSGLIKRQVNDHENLIDNVILTQWRNLYFRCFCSNVTVVRLNRFCWLAQQQNPSFEKISKADDFGSFS